MALTEDLLTWRGAWLAIAAALVSGIFALVLAARRNSDPREPPRLPHPIPLFGHMISYIVRGSVYLQRACESSGHRVVTLPLTPTFSMYLVGDPEAVRQVHRNSTTLVFEDMANWVVQRVTGVDKAVYDSLPQGPVMKDVFRVHQTTMLPGPKMADMLHRAYETLRKKLAEVDEVEGKVGKLDDVVRWLITEAGAKAMFGEDNPVTDDPSLVEKLRDFEVDSTKLIMFGPEMTFMRRLVAPRGHAAVEDFGKAFGRWHTKGLHEQASSTVYERHQRHANYYEFETMGRFDIGMLQAITSNTVPMLSWMMIYIYADPDLGRDVRSDLAATVPITTRADGSRQAVFDTEKLLADCPLLMSFWIELLRCFGVGPSARLVKTDTTLDTGHVLKEGNIVMMLTGMLHTSKAEWGPDADTFNARRHLGRELPIRVPGGSSKARILLPFGGGTAWCPGRHLVTALEVTAAAVLALAFEMYDADTGKTVPVPGWGHTPAMSSVRAMSVDPKVRLRRRKEWAGVDIIMTPGEEKSAWIDI